MSRSLTYRLWKTLTKKLVRDDATRKQIFSLVSEAEEQAESAATSNSCNQKEPTRQKEKVKEAANSHHRSSPPRLIIAMRGFYYSGSGALTAMFQEFDNIDVCGYAEPQFSKAKLTNSMSESTFFYGSKFCELVNSFRSASPSTVDYYLKHFIDCTRQACEQKRTTPWEYQPELYNDYFGELVNDFLFRILQLDDATRERMRELPFPTRLDKTTSPLYAGCNFVKEGLADVILYEFRDMSHEEFADTVSTFLRGFFSILGEKDIIVYDQLLHNDYLETVNRFLPDNPIKQVCVYRDPRDMYVSAFRNGPSSGLKDIDAFEQLYRNNRFLELYCGLEHILANPNPHRLLVRFEDLVLRYEEMVPQILKFLGIDARHHIQPRSAFVPALSVNNIGAYKHFANQDIIRQIEDRLGEYCFMPEKENLPATAWDLLESTGNWKRL